MKQADWKDRAQALEQQQTSMKLPSGFAKLINNSLSSQGFQLQNISLLFDYLFLKEKGGLWRLDRLRALKEEGIKCL